MAEGNFSFAAATLCRYFVHGACRQGENCKFSHNLQDRMDTVCRYYLKGQCTYAERCRYDHVRPKGRTTYTNDIPSPNFTMTHPKTAPSHRTAVPQNGRMPPPVHMEATTNNMVSLKKALRSHDEVSPLPASVKSPEQWVQASEFVPGQPYRSASIPGSYADAACTGTDPVLPVDTGTNGVHDPPLCPFAAHKGVCPYGDECEYVHGESCELCGLPVLYPGDPVQNEQHHKACVDQHEVDMELSFAIARSQNKQCGICMDTVMDKEPSSQQRFGILSDCTHCFCLTCIRQWRNSKQFENSTIRSCPECRVVSDFVTPSSFWVETKDDKLRVIEGYKRALSQISCRHFDEGRGECPFGNSCFYDHTYPDGSKPLPQRLKPRKRENADGIMDYVERMLISDFVEEYEDRSENLMLLEMIEEEISSLRMMNANLYNMFRDASDSD